MKTKEESKGSDWKETVLKTNESKGSGLKERRRNMKRKESKRSDWKETVLRRSVLKGSGFEERRKSEREVKER